MRRARREQIEISSDDVNTLSREKGSLEISAVFQSQFIPARQSAKPLPLAGSPLAVNREPQSNRYSSINRPSRRKCERSVKR
jgi:hypothetical protein